MVEPSQVPELRFIFWEVTVACNLECIHCRRLEVSKFLSQSDLSTTEAIQFIESLARDFNPKPVLVFSGGEPLARPDLFDLIRFAHWNEVPVALATNGTLVSQYLAKEIVHSGIRRVSISLDGATPQTHDRFRNMNGSFEKAVSGFRHLKSFGMSMQMNATLTRHNIHELEAIYKLSLDLGAESLHYFLLVPVGCGLEIKEEYQLTPEEYEKALLNIHGFASEKKIHIRPICAPHYFRILAQKRNSSPLVGEDKGGGKSPHPNLPPRRGEGISLNQLTKGCLAGTRICFVSHKGEVFPCGYLPISSGKVQNQGLKEIWETSPIFYQLRDPGFLGGKCGVCEFKRICSGCRARAYEEEGNFLAEEPNCLYEPRKKVSTN
ncbi:MAG: radical SAM protein [Candidatus Omnitrophica bacterium]|nr:radical SAM protein [Candidatus Omnitrophota bacterium]